MDLILASATESMGNGAMKTSILYFLDIISCANMSCGSFGAVQNFSGLHTI